MTFDFQFFHGKKLIRGINKLKLLLEFSAFLFPQCYTLFFRIIITQLEKSSTGLLPSMF